MRVSIAVIRWIRDKVPAALRRLLIKHEAERVPCRVQVNPEGRPGLHISLAGTQREHVLLTDIEIRHIEVQVSLLRVLVTRPHRRLVARSTLESQRSAAITAQLHPVVVVTVGLPTRDRSVELRQGTRVTAIERYQTEPCNTSHAANSTGGPRQSWLRTRCGRHRRGRPRRRMGGLRIAAVGPADAGLSGKASSESPGCCGDTSTNCSSIAEPQASTPTGTVAKSLTGRAASGYGSVVYSWLHTISQRQRRPIGHDRIAPPDDHAVRVALR
jgi:hypothetical protein